jgi:hypothetical protein
VILFRREHFRAVYTYPLKQGLVVVEHGRVAMPAIRPFLCAKNT